MRRLIALLLCFCSSGALAGVALKPTALPDPAAALERWLPRAAPQQRAQASQGWTMLLYFNADNNLWKAALRDVLEMQRVGSSANFHILLYLDGPAARRGGFDGTVYALVNRGQGNLSWDGVRQNLQILQNLPEQNSDDPSTLASFVNWGIRSYPAQHYGLVLWDHGGQWFGGFGSDESNGEQGMTTWEVRQAIRAGMTQSGLRQFDFFGFDTCLMGGLELLLEYADLAPLYIANPESDYGDGWDYTGTLGALRDNPNMGMRQFAQIETNFYRQQHSQSRADANEHAHVAYNTQNLGGLKNAVNTFVTAAIQSNDRAALLEARTQVVNYGFDPSDPDSLPLFMDLGQYAQLVAARTRNAALAQAGQALARAITDIEVASSIGPSKAGALGLSVFLPNDPKLRINDSIFTAYAQRLVSGSQENWKDFLALWFGKIAPSVTPVDLRITSSTNLLDPTDREPASVDFTVNGSATLIYAELGVVGERNSFLVYGQLYQQPGSGGAYSYGWDGRYFEISDPDGNTDILSGFFQRPNDPIFYANATYTPPGETRSFAVSVVVDVAKGKVVNVMDNSSTAPRSIPIEPYGVLRFNFLERDQITEETRLVPTKRFVTVPRNGIDGLSVTRNRLPIGEYVLIFGARDAVGNIRTGFVPVQIRQ